MESVSIVLLNYLNYQDTIECVNSIVEMDYGIAGIVIVDNHSDNGSFKILQKEYLENDKIIVVNAGKNYGFAKGNNIGINIARKRFHTDFVYVANNDIIFTQKDYFEKLLRNYEEDIGVIGSAIYLKNNVLQSYKIYVTLRENLILYMHDYCMVHQHTALGCLLPKLRYHLKVTALHGSALLLTPAFFRYYNGLYERTFLYNEEVILYFMCKKAALRQKYVSDTYVYHKEDRSSRLSFRNDQLIRSKYAMQSRKFVLWWILKVKVCDLLLIYKNGRNMVMLRGDL